MNKTNNIVYSVVNNKDKLICIDTKTGSTVGTFPFIGTLINGPIVTGSDQCTVVIGTATGKKGLVLKLPRFTTITSFNL